MIIIRPSYARGSTQLDWLSSFHTFSFGNYFDPAHHGFRTLRVINQDIIKPGAGFGTHPHNNMEILTYVISGAIAHKDSMDNETVVRPGEIQRMTAGAGVTHSEYNYSKQEPIELLQIWILPKQKELTPGYQQINFDVNAKGLLLLGSENGERGSVIIHQDVKLWRGNLDKDKVVTYDIAGSRYVWIQVISGKLVVNDHILSPGDGCAVSDEKQLDIFASQASEFLFFDLG